MRGDYAAELQTDSIKVDDYPQGYPRLAAVLQCDPNFPVYRRFKTLRHRVILHRQQELVQLERQLNDLDREDAEHRPYRIRSLEWDHQVATREGKSRSEREEIIDEIDSKLKQYGAVERPLIVVSVADIPR